MFERVLVLVGMMVAVSSCESPCDTVVNLPNTVCLSAGGTLQPGVPFALETDALSSTPVCEVRVNGTELELVVTGNRCTNRGVGEAEPEPPSSARCEVPALGAGTYSVKGTTTIFTVPGGGVQQCGPPQAATF